MLVSAGPKPEHVGYLGASHSPSHTSSVRQDIAAQERRMQLRVCALSAWNVNLVCRLPAGDAMEDLDVSRHLAPAVRTGMLGHFGPGRISKRGKSAHIFSFRFPDRQQGTSCLELSCALVLLFDPRVCTTVTQGPPPVPSHSVHQHTGLWCCASIEHVTFKFKSKCVTQGRTKGGEQGSESPRNEWPIVA